MIKIIQAGNSDAASFNDDSSPDTRLTSGQKLSVNAQVLSDSSLDWYCRLLQLCESVPGELKAAEVWPRFQTLQEEGRARVWTGLSKVRIHIVDPRPYRNSFDDIIRVIFRCNNPTTYLHREVALQNPGAIWLSRQLQMFIAERILSDSTGARVHSLSQFLNYGSGFLGQDLGSTEFLRLSDFGDQIRPLVRKVSTWAAKSAASFHEALDCVFDEPTTYFPNQIIKKRMEAPVLKTHTFDQGEAKHLELLERTRSGILKNLRYPLIARKATEIKPYSQLSSKDSYLLQAADIAAGIASKIVETQNLVAAVSSFEYVSYNGRRVSVSEAEEEVRRMRL